MENITFNDLFSSSLIEKTNSISVIDSIIGLVTAFLIGLFIYFIYKKTFSGVIYSHTFNISLIVMSMATALIIMGISSNVLLSLGMVGALSIVRFRTPIKDPMDIVYVFWSLIAGILCGAGFIVLVIIGSIAIGAVILVFVSRMKVEDPYLLIVKYTSADMEKTLTQAVSDHTKKYSLKSKSVMPGNDYEVTYEVRVKENDTSFINSISNMNGVRSAVMLSYDGNFTA